MNDFKYKPKHVVVKKKYTYIALAPALKQYRRGRLLTLYVQSPFPAPTLICLGSLWMAGGIQREAFAILCIPFIVHRDHSPRNNCVENFPVGVFYGKTNLL